MSITNFLSKETKKEYYWSLILEDDWVQAGIWTIEGDGAKVVSTSPATAWKSDDELINAADTALAAAVGLLPEDAKEPSKTVFGVPSDWVDKGQIKEELLAKIKDLCTSLSLEPSGFVVLSESITNLIKSEEGSPASCVVVGLSSDNLEVSLYRLGKMEGVVNVARSISLAEDLVEGLTRLQKISEQADTALPPRFVLYNGKEGELEDAKQALTRADWDQVGFKFLHPPKVEVVVPERKVMAVSLAGASEMADVKKAVSADALVQDESLEVPEKKEVDPKEFGFVVGKDVAQNSSNSQPVVKRKERIKKISFDPLRVARKLFSKIPRVRPKRGMAVVGLFIGLVFVGVFAYWWFAPKAEVVIFVRPKEFEEKLTLFIDPGRELVDVDEKLIPGRKVSKVVSSEKTSPTTGAKTVGEKSRGEVTIYRVGDAVTLKAGTKLESPGGLIFVLDEETSVDEGVDLTSPSETVAKVTAQKIGAESNLAEGMTFLVGNYSKSSMVAKNLSNFSGGTSREIASVSSEDRENIKSDLTDELTLMAKSQLQNEISPEDLLIEESIVSAVTSSEFDKKVGDEATSVKLSLELEVKGVVVNKKDLFEVAKSGILEKVPEGYALRETQINITFGFVEEKNAVLTFDVNYDVNLLPEVDPMEIAKRISGTLPSSARDYLNTLPSFTGAEITLNPTFPGKLGTLPRVPSRIQVEVAAESK